MNFFESFYYKINKDVDYKKIYAKHSDVYPLKEYITKDNIKVYLPNNISLFLYNYGENPCEICKPNWKKIDYNTQNNNLNWKAVPFLIFRDKIKCEKLEFHQKNLKNSDYC